MSDFGTHLQNLRHTARVSARKAVDFLDGYQQVWLESLLSSPGKGIKSWSERGVFPIWENLTQVIIEKSAQTYQSQPEREILNQAGEVDEAATDLYGDLLKGGGFRSISDHADELSRLLKTAIVLVQWNDETDRLYFEVLSQHNCDVDYDRMKKEFRSLIYTAGEAGPGGGEMYYYWTPEEIKAFEVTGTAFSKVGPTEPNPYGIIPAGVLYDIKPPRTGFWTKNVWEQLISFNEAVNLFHTETKFNQRFGAIGSPITNMTIPTGTVFGPDAVVELGGTQSPDFTPYFEYKVPQVQVNDFLVWLNSLRENVGQEWGVNIKVAGEGTADSGFKLVVEELPSLQLRKKRINTAIDFERNLYEVIIEVAKAGGVTLPVNSTVNIVFPEPDLPVDEVGKWAVAQGQMASKVLSREQYLRDLRPDWTNEQITDELAAIDASFGTVPDFTKIVDNGA